MTPEDQAIADGIARLRAALEAGPTPGPWMAKPADAWTSASGTFCQWGKFAISAGSVDFEDGRYYRIGEVSNVNNSPANESNAALIAACDPQTIAHLLAAHDEREALRAALRGLMSGCKYQSLNGVAGWHEKSIPRDADLYRARLLLEGAAMQQEPTR